MTSALSRYLVMPFQIEHHSVLPVCMVLSGSVDSFIVHVSTPVAVAISSLEVAMDQLRMILLGNP